MFIDYLNYIQSPFPCPMAHRASPISVSITLGHASANAVKATAWGWSTGSSASLTFPLHSHMSSARREGSEHHFKSLWYDLTGTRNHDLPVVRQTLYHWGITHRIPNVSPGLKFRGLIFMIVRYFNVQSWFIKNNFKTGAPRPTFPGILDVAKHLLRI